MRAAIVGFLLVLPTGLVIAETAAVPSVILEGVRTGVPYVPPLQWASVGLVCAECAAPVPANEWLWLTVERLSGTTQAFISVSYLSGGEQTRLISWLVGSKIGPFLLPAARPGETALSVMVDRIDGSGHTTTVFPIGSPLPLDPREIRISTLDKWEKHHIVADGWDSRVYYFFAGAGIVHPTPSGYVHDLSTTAGPFYVGSSWVGIGARGETASVNIAAIPPTTDVVVISPEGAHFGAAVKSGFMGRWVPGFDADLVYGYTGAPDRHDEVLLFSLNDTYTVTTVGEGEIWTVGSKTTGVRASAGHFVAQANARVEARATFDEASFVVARVVGGSFGSGSTRIEHDGHVRTGPIDFLQDRWVLSHGDCSGEWIASVDGTGAGTGPFDAGLLAMKGYTPSADFQYFRNTNNGWCSAG